MRPEPGAVCKSAALPETRLKSSLRFPAAIFTPASSCSSTSMALGVPFSRSVKRSGERPLNVIPLLSIASAFRKHIDSSNTNPKYFLMFVIYLIKKFFPKIQNKQRYGQKACFRYLSVCYLSTTLCYKSVSRCYTSCMEGILTAFYGGILLLLQQKNPPTGRIISSRGTK